MLALWSVLWRQSKRITGLLALGTAAEDVPAAPGTVAGPAAIGLPKIQIHAEGIVLEPARAGGSWAEYKHILDLNQPHWSAPKRKPPQPVPAPEVEPVVAMAISGTCSTSQGHGEVHAVGDTYDEELELIALLLMGGAA